MASDMRVVLVRDGDRSARVRDPFALPAGFSLESSDRLGLQIVRTLVTSELGGSIGLHPGGNAFWRFVAFLYLAVLCAEAQAQIFQAPWLSLWLDLRQSRATSRQLPP